MPIYVYSHNVYLYSCPLCWCDGMCRVFSGCRTTMVFWMMIDNLENTSIWYNKYKKTHLQSNYSIKSYIRHKDFLCPSPSSSSVTLILPPLKSETGWPGELCSNRIFFWCFSIYLKKKIIFWDFLRFSDFWIFFFFHFWHFLVFGLFLLIFAFFLQFLDFFWTGCTFYRLFRFFELFGIFFGFSLDFLVFLDFFKSY